MREKILSYFYRHARSFMISRTYARQEKECRQHDLEEVIRFGDKILPKLPPLLCRFPIPEGIGSYIHNLYFPSPITLASFKAELAVIDKWMELGLGGATTKTVMLAQNPGNPSPRIAQVDFEGKVGGGSLGSLGSGGKRGSGFLNNVGLESKGAINEADALVSSGVWDHGRPIGISIGGNSLEEYEAVFRTMDASRHLFNSQSYYEINASCPNTPAGKQLGEQPYLVKQLLGYMRDQTSAVIGVKLSPDTQDNLLLKMAGMIACFPRTYVNLGNTLMMRAAYLGLPREAVSGGVGGYSGPGLYLRTLGMVKLVRKKFPAEDLPIIATGGVDSAEKVIALQHAGAQIVGVASAIVLDMYCVPRMNKELAAAVAAAATRKNK